MKNLNLVEILKNCPEGTKLYSPIYGDVELVKVHHDRRNHPIEIKIRNYEFDSFSKDGRIFAEYDGECTLFPSKDQRDWSKFTAPWYKKEKLVEPKFKVGDKVRHKKANKDDVYEIGKVYDDSYGIVGFSWMIYMKYQDQYELISNKFDPKTLKPFDRVLVKDDRNEKWQCSFFSYIDNDDIYYPYVATHINYKYCIPYNYDTKHLVGTTKEAPEFYRYWEE